MKPLAKHLYKGKYYDIEELAAMGKTSKKNMYKRIKLYGVEGAVEYVAPPKNLNRSVLREYKGGLITVNDFCKETGLNRDTVYKKLGLGMNLDDIADYLLNRVPTNNHPPKLYDYYGEDLTIAEVAEREGIDSSNLYRKVRTMDIVSAVKEIKANKTKYFPHQGGLYSRAQLVEMYPNISSTKLYAMLDTNLEYTEEEVDEILLLCNKDERTMVGDVSLYQYCIDNKYNYYVINYLVKKKNMPVMDAIEYYLENGQNNPVNGKYFVGNILLSHFCIKEQLDVSYILYYLYQKKSLHEAVTRYCFLSHDSDITKERKNFLACVYMIWEISAQEYKDGLLKHYKLTQKEINILLEEDLIIKRIMRNYDLFRLSCYLDSGVNHEEINSILNRHDLTFSQAIDMLDKLYNNFETTNIQTPKFKWRN